jgi:6-pyruvoyltetrahydropterin/6-carboxytetrahydropterin synthase
VSVEVDGELSDKGLVIDFKLVKPIIRDLCDELDEHWLIPGEHQELTYEHGDDGHTTVVYRDCRYMAPTDEVIVLPINNSSAENLASWFGRTIYDRLTERFGRLSVRKLRLAVSETSGQHGVYTLSDD